MEADVVVIATGGVLFGLVLILAFGRHQLSMQLRMQRIESFNRLVEKFTGAKEFVEFAQSPQGKALLAEPAAAATGPLARVLRFLQAGVLFIMLGIGYWINALRVSPGMDINSLNQARESGYWGMLAMCLGVGLLIVAGITYLLIKRWHLADVPQGR